MTPLSQILEDHEGKIAVVVEGQVFKLNEEVMQFEHYFTPSNDLISHIVFDDEGGFWYGSFEGKGVSYYQTTNRTGDADFSIEIINNENPDYLINGLEIIGDYLWIGIEEGGIAKMHIPTGKLTRYFEGTTDRFVFAVYKDNFDRLWSCDYGGLKIYVEEEDFFFGYYHIADDPFSVRINVSGVFVDYQGNIYTFHNGEGVQVSYVQRGFQLFNKSDRVFWYLEDHNISSLHEDVNGNLWMGSFNGGISIFEWEKLSINRFPTTDNQPNQLGRGTVHVIYRDMTGDMWIGTHGGGLQKFCFADSTFASWRKGGIPGTTVSHNDIRSIEEDSKGNLWIGTHGGGIDYFDRKTGSFRNYNLLNNKLSSDWLNDLLVDSKNRLWAATSFGLCLLNEGDSIFVSYLANTSDETALHGNVVLCLFEDSKDQLWVGTNSGLFFFNEANQSFHRKGHGLANSYISSIEEDQFGQFWVATLGGLHRLDPESGRVYYFDERDGLQGQGFNLRASYFNGNDALFFAGNRGVNVFNPATLNYNTLPPLIKFTSFLLFNREITDYGEGKILEKHISVVDEIELEYGENYFTIEFVAFNMISPDRNLYEVMLEGFDKDWIELGNRRSASYTNLNPGTYTFKVRASNNDGIWNEEGISVRIRVKPPWWLTIWFFVGILVLLTTMLLVFIQVKTGQLRKQKNKLAHQVAEQTWKLRKNNAALKQRTVELNRTNRVLEERQKMISDQAEELELQADSLKKSNSELIRLINTKDKLFSIIAHDLRMPFNTILGLSSLLVEYGKDEEPEKVATYAKHVHESSLQVYNLIENLLYWAQTQTDEITLLPTNVQTDEFVAENIDLVQESIFRKGLTLDVSGYFKTMVYADSNTLKIVVRNLLTNAIKFTPQGGTIRLFCDEDSSEVTFYIQDTGVGISKEQIDRITDGNSGNTQKGTDGEKGSGLGLVLCDEFIKRNGGKFMISSMPGVGSTFSFTIPKMKKL
jgi:signal transduction histidine kinase/ligand-binding sensor domain-containing protein